MTIDYQVLREAAEKATPDEWVAFISTDTGTYAVHTPGDERCEDVIKWTGFDGQKNAENNARHVAAFNPKVALELLGEIKCLEDTNIDAMCRIAELETNLAALVAENAGLKAICDDRRRFIMNGVQMGYIKVPAAETDPDLETIRIAISPQKPIPATDAFLAEVRAQGVDMARNAMIDFVDGEVGPNKNVPGLIRGAEICVSIAEQLRKGGNQ
ncbi:ead/Ea22-like family protein [Escherichia coli]|nr:ead/Ea22-like family protein [Escherichia coli]EFH4224835.1 ead/Ea22-like family protein [Escherichia coli]EFN6029000.1 ead/Ea22-like family protein [Escherichia coli]EFQ6871955.1 ead/Ea22-like family protein [Escherichia coli]HCL9569352.1 ead/Ea22-like family protein [Escherichia coli]